MKILKFLFVLAFGGEDGDGSCLIDCILLHFHIFEAKDLKMLLIYKEDH